MLVSGCNLSSLFIVLLGNSSGNSLGNSSSIGTIMHILLICGPILVYLIYSKVLCAISELSHTSQFSAEATVPHYTGTRV